MDECFNGGKKKEEKKEIPHYLNNDVPRPLVDLHVVVGQLQALRQRRPQRRQVALGLLDQRQLPVAAPLAPLVHGQVVARRARDVEGEGRPRRRRGRGRRRCWCWGRLRRRRRRWGVRGCRRRGRRCCEPSSRGASCCFCRRGLRAQLPCRGGQGPEEERCGTQHCGAGSVAVAGCGGGGATSAAGQDSSALPLRDANRFPDPAVELRKSTGRGRMICRLGAGGGVGIVS